MSKKRKEEFNSVMTVVKEVDGTTKIYTAKDFEKLDVASQMKKGGTMTGIIVTRKKKTKPHKAKH